jgi:hypothetical protein
MPLNRIAAKLAIPTEANPKYRDCRPIIAKRGRYVIHPHSRKNPAFREAERKPGEIPPLRRQAMTNTRRAPTIATKTEMGEALTQARTKGRMPEDDSK